MSLLADYFKEKGLKEIIEDENGFATYMFLPEGVYIEDIYVRPEARKSGHASKYADQIAEIARAKGFSKMFGSVVPSSNGSADSFRVLLAYGFQPNKCTNNLVIFVKDI